jgi:uncharacterized delta-60 repeat protein
MTFRCSWGSHRLAWTAVLAAVAAATVPVGWEAAASPTRESVARSRDWAYALAVQPDGKIVAVGRSADHGWRFALARYTANGRLDPSFGRGGRTRTAFGSHGQSGAAALAIQRDGRLVAAGWTRVSALEQVIALGRYTDRGRLDPGFGTGGKVVTDLGWRDHVSAWANAVAVESDGKVVVGGQSSKAAGQRAALIRYTRAGRLDPSFGSRGIVVSRIGFLNDTSAIAIQPDSKIVAAGGVAIGESTHLMIARYNTDGTFDRSFGNGGSVVTDFGSYSALAIQPDGKLVAAGGAGGDFAVARYTTDGKLDSTFGSRGKVVTNFGTVNGSYSSEAAHAMAMQPDGKIVVVGASDLRGRDDGSHTLHDFAIARYTADGKLDPIFGSRGTVLTDFGDSFSSNAESVAIQPGGKIVVAGGGGGYFALARYSADGTLDTSFGRGGKVRTRFRG